MVVVLPADKLSWQEVAAGMRIGTRSIAGALVTWGLS